jgi:hypothetical protein
LYFFRISGTTDLCVSFLALLAANAIVFGISALVLSIRKARNYWILSDLIAAKHILISFLIFSSAWIIFQPCFAFLICLLWTIFGKKFFTVDQKIEYLTNFEINERGKYKRLNADINAVAKEIQADLPKKAKWHEILASYRQKAALAKTFDAEHRPNFKEFRIFSGNAIFIATFAVPIAVGVDIITDFGYSEVIQNAVGFASGLVIFNEIVSLTAFFAWLFACTRRINAALPSTSNDWKGPFLVIFLYLLLLILFLGAAFRWF